MENEKKTIRIQRVNSDDFARLEVIAMENGYQSVQEFLRNIIRDIVENDRLNFSENQAIVQQFEKQYIGIKQELSELKIKQDIMLMKLNDM
ncbi:hypothetical protein HAU32_08380 [Weissella confusa]|nr:hypothetical protein [Weissella confusa]MBJ7688988.1 hypothetical protein [Weissella confusa]